MHAILGQAIAAPCRYLYDFQAALRLRQPENPVSPYFLGAKDGTAYVFHYEPDRATDLSWAFLQTIRAETLPEKPERWVIYADRTLLSDEQMQRLNIVFKRIPRDISKL